MTKFYNRVINTTILYSNMYNKVKHITTFYIRVIDISTLNNLVINIVKLH